MATNDLSDQLKHHYKYLQLPPRVLARLYPISFDALLCLLYAGSVSRCVSTLPLRHELESTLATTCGQLTPGPSIHDHGYGVDSLGDSVPPLIDAPERTCRTYEADLGARQLYKGSHQRPDMRFAAILSLSFISVVLPSVTSVTACKLGTAQRARALERFEKRSFDNARLTWYDVTTDVTACGGRYSANDYVVALNTPQYGSGYPGPNCGRNIRITSNGKTVDATIVDVCPGCPEGGLDLTQGLFSAFANPDTGVLDGSWDFI